MSKKNRKSKSTIIKEAPISTYQTRIKNTRTMRYL